MNDSRKEMDGILVGKYLAGEASPEEVIQLEDWISVSASNKLLFDQFVATWNGVQLKPGYQSPDKAEAWRTIQQAIDQPLKTGGSFRKFILRYPAAAAVVGILVLSIVPLIFFTRTGNISSVKTISVSSLGTVQQTTLPDGSSIVLNRNSVITYPEKFRPGHREATLQGEAFFNVVPDAGSPFKISVENVDILVLGTSFNLRKAVDGTIETQVKSGRVKMFNRKGEVIISAGQTGVYNAKTSSFLLKKELDPNEFSYATKNFLFSDEKLETIIKHLETAYGRTIILKNKQVGKCKMTSSFSNKSIDYILDVIAATLNLTYTIEEGIIYIGGQHEGC